MPKITRQDTGESFSFDWPKDKAPPSPQDIDEILKAHSSLKTPEKTPEKMGSPAPVVPKGSLSEQLGSIGNVGKAAFNTIMERTGLNPVQHAEQLAKGTQQVISGQNQPGEQFESPRVAGAGKLLGGGLGLAGIGTSVLAPEAMATKRALGGLATGVGVQKATEKFLPESWKPEIRELLAGLAGAGAGIAVGHPSGKAPAGEKIAPTSVNPIDAKPVGPVLQGAVNRPLPDQGPLPVKPPGPVGPPVVNRPLSQPLAPPPIQARPMPPVIRRQPPAPPVPEPRIASRPLPPIIERQPPQAPPPEAPVPQGPPINRPLPEQVAVPRPPMQVGPVTNRPLVPPEAPPEPPPPPPGPPMNQPLPEQVTVPRPPMQVGPVVNRPFNLPEIPGTVTPTEAPTVRRDANGRPIKAKKLETPAVDVPEKVVKKAQEAIKPVGPVKAAKVKKPTPIIGPAPTELQAQADALHVDPYEIPGSPEKVTPSAAPEVPEPKAPEKVKVPEEQAEQIRKYDNFLKTTERYKSTKDPTKLISLAAKQAKDVGHGAEELRDDLESAGWEKGHIEKAVQEAFPTEMGVGKKPQISEKRRRSSRGSISLKDKPPVEEGPEKESTSVGRRAAAFWTPLDEFLEDRPETAHLPEMANKVHYGEQGSQKFKYDRLRELQNAAKNFPASKKGELYQFLNGTTTTDPQVRDVGNAWTSIIRGISQEMKAKGGEVHEEPVQFVRDLAERMQKDETFGDSIKNDFSNLTQKTGLAEAGKKVGLTLDPLDKDPFALVRKVVDNAAHIIYKKGFYKEGMESIKAMPEGFQKEMAKSYIERASGVSRPDDPGGKIFRGIDRMGAKLASRSVLAFSPSLQALHGMRLVMQGIPQVGLKYGMKGLAEVVSNPRATFGRAARSGLQESRIVPRRFRTTGESFDNILNLYDVGNSFAKTVMLEANRAKFKEMGDPNFEQRAITSAARQEGVGGPTSPIRASDTIPKSLFMWKDWMLRYGSAAGRAMIKKDVQGNRDLKPFLMMVAGGATATMLKEATGMRISHIPEKVGDVLPKSPTPQMRAIYNAVTHIDKGDWDAVATDIEKILIPGGSKVIKGSGADADVDLSRLWDLPLPDSN